MSGIIKADAPLGDRVDLIDRIDAGDPIVNTVSPVNRVMSWVRDRTSHTGRATSPLCWRPKSGKLPPRRGGLRISPFLPSSNGTDRPCAGRTGRIPSSRRDAGLACRVGFQPTRSPTREDVKNESLGEMRKMGFGRANRLVLVGPGGGLRSWPDLLATVGENESREDRDVKYDEYHVHPNTPLSNALHP